VLKASQIQGNGFIVYGVQTKCEPLLLVHLALLNCQKHNRIEKIMTPQSREGQEFKKKTTECYKGRFPNAQKILCMLLY